MSNKPEPNVIYIHHTNNWGDAIAPQLASLISGKESNPFHYYTQDNGTTTYALVGSIIELLADSKIEVCGAGFISANGRLRVNVNKIHSVRGPLTRELLLKQGHECPEVYGDPALLYPKYYNPKVEKKYKLGIIPHYIDFDNPVIKKFANHKDIKIINICKGKEDLKSNKFVDEVLECENVVSSSLHGIILADAYKIPTGWVKLSNKVIGDGFKFRDYFHSVKKTDMNPLIFDNQTSYEDLLNKINHEEIDIDLDLLLNSIPFKA